MIPANTQCSLLHYRDVSGAANNMYRKQWYRQLFSSTVWQHTVVSNTTACGSINGIYSDANTRTKALQLLNLVNTDSKVRLSLPMEQKEIRLEYTDDNKIYT